ncbi:hypothetical protein GGS21DRAFT_543582 [Xylaria nigripes]|nr:hypothetical protein GGS21DRAFT_543582 [Xylaria nigripes]
MHYIRILNRSGLPQTFQCHGYNNNQDLTVAANGQASLEAADGTSGAIIAVHEGQIGEQCEITKAGFGGNDVIDISNICGAGGNMTCQQAGDPPTKYKGHETFMQACNAAWKSLPQPQKDELKNFVFLDGSGNVKRIGAPKDSQPLEQFVRTFANGRTYIGVGAWGGSQGNPEDNKQSAAGQGSKDVLIVYSDGNAAPGGAAATNGVQKMAVPAPAPAAAKANGVNGTNGVKSFRVAAAAPAVPGPGILLTNTSAKKNTYFFYDNYWNGNGTAGANFDHPLKSVEVGPNQTIYVPLDLSFKGRVQRGDQQPATWGEFQIKASDDGGAHGDISIEQGCDGAATLASTDGSNVSNGFTTDILKDAPAAALDTKPNGEKALASTMGNWKGPGNTAAIDWANKFCQGKAYVVGGTGVPDVASKNNCLHFTFYV